MDRMRNINDEWCVAYHGVGHRLSSNNAKKVTGLIYKNHFKEGSGQRHKNCPDKFHKGKQVLVFIALQIFKLQNLMLEFL